MSTAMICLSLLLIALACAIAWKKGAGPALRYTAAVCTLLVLMLTCFFVVSDYFSGVGIDESVIFHLSYGLSGAGFGEYPGVIAGAAAFIGLALVAALGVFRGLAKRGLHTSWKWSGASAALMLAAVGSSPASVDLAGLYLARSWSGDADFRYLEPVVRPSRDPMNLVVVYLESFERNYLDQALFPGLTPGLSQLERQARTFTNVAQVYGTGWTVAGMTASQCGIPLVTGSAGDEKAGNSMSGLSEFLPGATCIGDILASQHYLLDFMGGASLDFAGKGNLYRTHGFQNVRGLAELRTDVANAGYRSSWGLYDDTILDLAQRRLVELSAQSRPFGMFLLTLGTHHPHGHVSASCAGKPYGDGGNPILNAAHCTDALVVDFVRKIRASAIGHNTLIVLASDHLAMPNSASAQLKSRDRKNLLMIIDPRAKQPAVVDRAASTLDVAPTVLSLMGFNVDGLGLGRDIAGVAPTLMEKMPDAAGFLASQAPYLAGLWQFPQIDDGLVIDATRKQAQLGTRKVKLPALLVIDDDRRVSEILFDFSSRKSLVEYIAEAPASQSVIWVDACARVDVLDAGGIIAAAATAPLCIAAGRVGAKAMHLAEVPAELALDAGALGGFLDAAADERTHATRRARLETFRSYGVAEVTKVRVFPSAGLGGDLLVRATAGPGTSYLKTPPQAPGRAPPLSRGLTLFGVSDNAFEKVAHHDSCNPGRPVADASASGLPFREHIARNTRFTTFVLVGHDSVLCRSSADLSPFFAGLPLTEWKSIGYRQTYIAVLRANGEAREFRGDPGAALALHLTGFASPGERTR